MRWNYADKHFPMCENPIWKCMKLASVAQCFGDGERYDSLSIFTCKAEPPSQEGAKLCREPNDEALPPYIRGMN